MPKVDDAFYDRADAHINLSNDQLSEEVGPGKVLCGLMRKISRETKMKNVDNTEAIKEISAE